MHDPGEHPKSLEERVQLLEEAQLQQAGLESYEYLVGRLEDLEVLAEKHDHLLRGHDDSVEFLHERVDKTESRIDNPESE